MIYNLTKYNSRWETRKLNSLGDFSRGKSKHRPRNDAILYQGGGYPFIQTGEIKAANLFITSHEQEYNDAGLAQSKLWSEGTLAITIAANIAETGILAYPMCFPDSVVGFTAYTDETSELFMHYIFSYIRAAIQKSVGGSIQDNINIDYLENLDFKIPDISVQSKMLNVLAALDRKIAINKAINAELEKAAKLLYDYWFVQFDFPDENGKPYRASGGEMENNEKLRREIPKGWEVLPVETLLSPVESKRMLLTDEYLDVGRTPVIDQSKDYIVGFTNAHDVVIRNLDEAIVFGDHTRIFKFINFEFARGADGTQIIVSNTKRMPQILFYFSLKSFDLSNYGYSRHFKFLKDQRVIIPHLEIAEEYASIVSLWYQRIRINIFENYELTALRDFLLPLLMNGQVTVNTD